MKSQAPIDVKAVPPAAVTGTLDNLALEGIWYPRDFIDPQKGPAPGGNYIAIGKHCSFAISTPPTRVVYGLGGDGNHPWSPGSSAANRFPSFTINADGSAMTYADWYPHFGIAGKPYPIGMDVVPFTWDSVRDCFWSWGGNFSEATPGANSIGTAHPLDGTHEIYRFLRGANAWEFAGIVAVQSPGESLNGCHVPPGKPGGDKVYWMTQGGSESGMIEWFDPANPATQGRFTIGIKPGQNPFSELPGVNQFSDPNDRIDWRPLIFDEVRNELIWTCYKSNYAGVYASALANFPNNTTTRQVYRGFEAGTTAGAQSPMAKRGRKLIIWGYPFGSTGTAAGAEGNCGMGFIEIDIDTGVRRDAPQPYFLTYDGSRTSVPWPVHGYNEGTYNETADRIVATSQVGAPALFTFSAPKWTPASGTLKKITTDIFGAPVNFITSPGVRGWTSQETVSEPWAYLTNGSPWAFSGGCYARNMSTNGCLIHRGGGNGDYWGNENYAFDFDTRKWYRISNASAAMTGNTLGGGANFGPSLDPTLPTSNAKYFNIAECEHGPLVAATGACSFGDWGILPAGTQPASSHIYSGVQWIPGSMVGNRRGAIVDVFKSLTYTTRSSGRSHYFDCDRLNATYYPQQWGRLSKNKATPHVIPPVTSVDLQANRILHNSGYLDLDPLSATCNQHVSKAWDSSHGSPPPGPSSSGPGCAFDTSRRLWVVTASWSGSDPLWCRFVDGASETQFKPPSFIGDPLWTNLTSGIGIEYVPTPIDAFFVYAPEDDPQKMWKLKLPSNPKTQPWVVSRITMGPDTVDDYITGYRIWSRLRWIPPLKCLAFYVGGPGGHVYLYTPVSTSKR